MQGYLLVAGETVALALHPGPRLPDGRAIACDADAITIGDRVVVAAMARDGDHLWLHVDGRILAIEWRDAVEFHAAEASGDADRIARAPMPGSVIRVDVAPGDAVALGDVLLVIESMKLETSIRAGVAGVVEAIHVAEGQSFERDASLVTLAARD